MRRLLGSSSMPASNRDLVTRSAALPAVARARRVPQPGAFAVNGDLRTGFSLRKLPPAPRRALFARRFVSPFGRLERGGASTALAAGLGSLTSLTRSRCSASVATSASLHRLRGARSSRTAVLRLCNLSARSAPTGRGHSAPAPAACRARSISLAGRLFGGRDAHLGVRQRRRALAAASAAASLAVAPVERAVEVTRARRDDAGTMSSRTARHDIAPVRFEGDAVAEVLAYVRAARVSPSGEPSPPALPVGERLSCANGRGRGRFATTAFAPVGACICGRVERQQDSGPGFPAACQERERRCGWISNDHRVNRRTEAALAHSRIGRAGRQKSPSGPGTASGPKRLR